MPVIVVASDAEPVRLVFNVSVAGSDPGAVPSAAVVEPERVTVAESLSVTLRAPLPAVLTDAFEVGAASRSEDGRVGSTNRSSLAPTDKNTVSHHEAPALNGGTEERNAAFVAGVVL